MVFQTQKREQRMDFSESWRSEFTCVRYLQSWTFDPFETTPLFDHGSIDTSGVLSSLSQPHSLCHGLGRASPSFFPLPSAMLSHWLRVEREVSHTTANRLGYLVHRTFSGMEPDSDLTRSSRLACIAVKLAVRLVTERVLFFVIDNHRLSDYDIEDANVHR